MLGQRALNVTNLHRVPAPTKRGAARPAKCKLQIITVYSVHCTVLKHDHRFFEKVE